MWRVIYIAPNQGAAERIRTLLEGEGILVRLSTTGLRSVTGTTPVEIMVPSGEAAEAHDIVTQALGRTGFQQG